MKIIGTTARGYNTTYLVEITEEEIARCMGFSGTSDAEYKSASSQTKREGLFPSGAEIGVGRKVDMVNTIAWKERTALEGAEALESLAKLLRGSMPSNFFTPPPEPEPEPQKD